MPCFVFSFPSRLSQRFPTLRSVFLFALYCGFASAASADDHSLTCSHPVQTVPSAPAPATQQPSGPPPVANSIRTDVGKITTDPLQFDLKLFSGHQSATVSIENDTSSDIDEIDISSLGLLDGKTGRLVPFLPKIGTLSDLNGAKTNLKIHERTDCTFQLPSSNYAGIYTGTLRIQASGRETTVPLTLRTRGPLLPCWNGFPLLTLTGVFLVGWGLSVLLDNWYTAGLPRVQQVLLLREQQAAMSNFLAELASWENKYKSVLPKTGAVVAFDKSDLDTALLQANVIPLLELQQDEQRFALACHLNDELWTALQVAGEKVPAPALPTVVGQLDGLMRGTDPSSYRNSLLQILTSPSHREPPSHSVRLPQGSQELTCRRQLRRSSAAEFSPWMS